MVGGADRIHLAQDMVLNHCFSKGRGGERREAISVSSHKIIATAQINRTAIFKHILNLIFFIFCLKSDINIILFTL